MRQRCWQSVFFCWWEGFWEYQELLICCIPSSLQWVVCALRACWWSLLFLGGYSEIKGTIYLQFLCYCRTRVFFFFYLEENYNLCAAALKVKIYMLMLVTLCNDKFEHLLTKLLYVLGQDAIWRSSKELRVKVIGIKCLTCFAWERNGAPIRLWQDPPAFWCPSFPWKRKTQTLVFAAML